MPASRSLRIFVSLITASLLTARVTGDPKPMPVPTAATAIETRPAATFAEPASLQALSEAIASVVEATKPSVVNIKAISNGERVPKELRRLMGSGAHPVTGTGSGVIFNSQGDIVTNNHLVGDADRIDVTLADGRQYRAKLIGTDVKCDLAVIHIVADHLSAARWADSDACKVGHIVLAIGSPFRLGHSVSHGIISALGRSDVDVEIEYQNWIQTDAPINPGNSGGPLINTRGEVVGINVAIATESGGHQGVGFAIPSNVVKHVASILQRGDQVVRGYLGVELEPVNDKIADTFGLPDQSGVAIRRIFDGTPAERSGLRPDDVVLGVDNQKIRSRGQLMEVIAGTQPGSKVTLKVWRNGRAETVKVSIGKQSPDFSPRGSLRELRQSPVDRDSENEEAEQGAPVEDQSGSAGEHFSDLGFDAITLTPSLAREHQVGKHIKSGVIITRVEPLGEADSAELKTDNVIVRANDKQVRNLADLKQVLTKDAISHGVKLLVKGRDNKGERLEFTAVLRVR